MVRELAGHASIKATRKYYTRIMPESLRSAQAEIPFDGIICCEGDDVSDTYQQGGRGQPRKK